MMLVRVRKESLRCADLYLMLTNTEWKKHIVRFWLWLMFEGSSVVVGGSWWTASSDGGLQQAWKNWRWRHVPSPDGTSNTEWTLRQAAEKERRAAKTSWPDYDETGIGPELYVIVHVAIFNCHFLVLFLMRCFSGFMVFNETGGEVICDEINAVKYINVGFLNVFNFWKTVLFLLIAAIFMLVPFRISDK